MAQRVDLQAVLDAVNTVCTDPTQYSAVAMGVFREYGIRCRFEMGEEFNPATHRMLLTTVDKFTDYNEYVTTQCYGAVCAAGKILAMPPAPFNKHASLRSVFKRRGTFRVYPAFDGTMVSLYWYGEKWCISTANGYEVSEYKWIGPKTYAEVVSGALATIGKTFDNLDKGTSYTIIVRDPDWHPLLQDNRKIVLVHRYNTATGVTVGAETDSDGFPYIKAIDSPVLRDLVEWNRDSLNLFRTTHNAWYGFIVRADWDIHGANSNIYVESHLMKSIRKMMYSYYGVVNDKVKYSVLRAYLHTRTAALFMDLFPQFNKTMLAIKSIINEISLSVMTAMSNVDERKRLEQSTDHRDYVIKAILGSIEQEKISIVDVNSIMIINDLIRSPKYIDLFASLV